MNLLNARPLSETVSSLGCNVLKHSSHNAVTVGKNPLISTTTGSPLFICLLQFLHLPLSLAVFFVQTIFMSPRKPSICDFRFYVFSILQLIP